MASIRYTVGEDYNSSSSAEAYGLSGVYTNSSASYYIDTYNIGPGDAFFVGNGDLVASSFLSTTGLSSALYANQVSIRADFSDNIGSVSLTGGNFGDELLGGEGADLLRGGAGSDTLSGGAGDDTIEGGTGSNQIDGGSGVNTLSYANLPIGSGAEFGVYVQLQNGFSFGNDGAVSDSLANIQNVIGTSISDFFYGDAAANVFEGGGGADFIDGRDGIDTVSYEHSGAGVTVNLATNVNTGGDAGGDTLSNIENITGSGYADSLTGDAGANRLDGLAGADTLIGGAGADTMVGGAGVDTVSYETATIGVKVDLQDPSSNYGYNPGNDAEGDTYAGIENIRGSAFTDLLYGDGGANVIEGGAGGDVINGRGGNDTVTYEHSGAAVTINLETGENRGGDAGSGIPDMDRLLNIENITGSRYADSLTGDGGANRLYGFGGADTLSGGGGDDTYIVRDVRAVVIEQANAGRDLVQATVNYKLTDNVENLTLISNAIDGTGNGLVNAITGSAKANVIDGKGGSDVLYGKGGADTFVFSTALGSGNVDRIVDFDGDDTIRLDSTIFSQFSAGDLSDDVFKNLDLGRQDANDKILYDQDTGRLFYDADGKGGEAAKLFALIGNHADLDASDFRIV